MTPDHLRHGRAGPVRRHRHPERAAAVRVDHAGPAAKHAPPPAGRDLMLGKLTWAAIPFDQPIPLVDLDRGDRGDPRRARPGSPSRAGGPTSGASGSPPSTTSASASCTALLALVMLLRGFTDAIMMRSQQALACRRARLSAARALRPDLLGARHDHDLLRGHAVRDRADELRRAAAARRARRGLPDAQFGELLADRLGRAAGQRVARRRRVRAGPAGSPIRRSPSSPTRPASASTTTSGRCRSPASARC